jgi:very-short-patch-repair endonuclease
MDGKRGRSASEETTRLIRRLAESQHGVVARRQLLVAGLGKGAIQGRVDSGNLIPLHRGVYALGHRRSDMLHLWMAAVLACGDRAALSHGSAAHLWGLRRSRGAIEVTRPSGGRPRAGILLRRALAFTPEDLTKEKGIPVTTLAWTLLDIAADLDLRQLERALAAADRSGRLSWSKLQRAIQRGSGHAGVARLRHAAQVVDPRVRDTRSPLEVEFLALCREAGLPLPQVNVLVEGNLVDFLWSAQRVVVETDGYLFHRDRLAFERDREIPLALNAAGYQVFRVTYRMLKKDPRPFLGLLRRSLGISTRSP